MKNIWLTENQDDVQARKAKAAARIRAADLENLMLSVEADNIQAKRYPCNGENIDLLKVEKIVVVVSKAKYNPDSLSDKDKRLLNLEGWIFENGAWCDTNAHGQGVDPRLKRTHIMREPPKWVAPFHKKKSILRNHKDVA